MSQKFRVITVHGVNTKGAWQEEVAEALKVFFDFEPIKYNHYRWFCGSELVFNPFIWLPLGIALTILIARGEVRGPIAISFSIFAILLLALLGTYPYRRWATKVFRERLSKEFETGGPSPFLIAHSFGTYLTGTSLQELSWPHYERIVVAGCVLEKDFPWDNLHRETPPRLREVRNEMAAKDNVARLAAWLDRLIPGFGSAGYSGFVGSPEAVHNIESANTVCAVCEATLDRAPVHNVKCEELGHSDVFLGPSLCRDVLAAFFVGLRSGGVPGFPISLSSD